MHLLDEFNKTLATEGEIHKGWDFHSVDGDEHLVQGFYTVNNQQFKFDICYEKDQLVAAFSDESGCTTFSCYVDGEQPCGVILLILLSAIGFAENADRFNS